MTDCPNTITAAVNAGKSIVIVWLDVTKAFDGVSNRRLRSNIESYGIIDSIILRFTSCFSSRIQVVRVKYFDSYPRLVTGGIIQGSVLCSPLLLLYLIDVFDIVGSGVLFLLADDIEIVYTFHPEALGSIIGKIV